MPISPLRRKVVPLVLAGTLAASWVSATVPRTDHPQAPTAVSLIERLGRAWSLLVRAWGEEGCNIDPSGLCAKPADSSPRQTDEGCNIDPDGRCR
jgi:hypothetical protein